MSALSEPVQPGRSRTRSAIRLVGRIGRATSYERRLCLRALISLVRVRLALRVRPGARVLARVEARAAEALATRRGHHQVDPRRVARVVTVLARVVPGASCLTQALVGMMLLAENGTAASVKIGVAREEGGEFRAHAWLTVAGCTLIGGGAMDRYQVLLELPRAS